MVGDQCITVLDSGETENEVSHCGDPWLPDDELIRVLGGQSLQANVLDADDFGVWVSAPFRYATPRARWWRRSTLTCPPWYHSTTLCRPIAPTPWRRCSSQRRSASAGPRSRPSPTASRASTTTATCTSVSRRSSKRARRRDTKLSLLFCDCDHFKVYNDTYGHKAGDAALARIARIIEACSRRTDLAARYGGEEFVLALVDTEHCGSP